MSPEEVLADRLYAFGLGHMALCKQTAQYQIEALKAEGFLVVPIEPTELMIRMGSEPLAMADPFDGTDWSAEKVYRAMVRSAEWVDVDPNKPEWLQRS